MAQQSQGERDTNEANRKVVSKVFENAVTVESPIVTRTVRRKSFKVKKPNLDADIENTLNGFTVSINFFTQQISTFEKTDEKSLQDLKILIEKRETFKRAKVELQAEREKKSDKVMKIIASLDSFIGQKIPFKRDATTEEFKEKNN